MKKPILLSLTVILLSLSARSQDMGYKTVDVGAEYLYSSKGYTASLHLAYNFPVHHGLQFQVGYNSSDWGEDGNHAHEKGNGPGFALGYRYYFLVRPHGFFLGAKADVWRLKIDWSQNVLPLTGTSKIWAVQPAAEMGYMFLINDLFFISPTICAGVQTNIKTDGETVGDGFIPQFGISAGWKF